jgi:AraC-like DNA-binding protein
MYLSFEDKAAHGKMCLNDYSCSIKAAVKEGDLLYRIVWVKSGTASFVVDAVNIELTQDQVAFFTPHNRVEASFESKDVIAFSFNREFYCLNENFHEVSCYGDLFYGSSSVPIITLNEAEQRRFSLMSEVFVEEFQTEDHIQGEMLRMLLKRLLIKSSRLTRELFGTTEIEDQQFDLVRQYNVLVEQNFREKHQVKDYAELLFKSAKTLSNVFATYNELTPLQVIYERIVLEAKRLLAYSDKRIEEIAFELGYAGAPHFSKFFKKQTGLSPKQFRDQAN